MSINVIQILDCIRLAFIYVNTPRACNMNVHRFFNSIQQIADKFKGFFFNAKFFTCTNFSRVEKHLFCKSYDGAHTGRKIMLEIIFIPLKNMLH